MRINYVQGESQGSRRRPAARKETTQTDDKGATEAFQQLLSEGKTFIQMIEENETARRETESPRALKCHTPGNPGDISCCLNNGKPDEMRAFSLRKFCTC